jgi:hypothetical protein
MRSGVLVVVCVLLAAVCLDSIASAQPTWLRTYGGTGHDWARSFQQTTDGGYILAGGTRSFGAGDFDVYLIKTDAQGDTLWTRTYGGTGYDEGQSVQRTTDGGYIVAGWAESLGAGGHDVYLVKTNASGDTLWTRTYGGAGPDGGYSVQQTTDGGYIIAGYNGSTGGGGGAYLIKTNAQGDTLWTRTYGGVQSDVGRSVQQTTDGGYVVAGSTQSFGTGWGNVYLIKTDAQGDTLWTRAYGHGGQFFDVGTAVQQTTDGGYIMSGSTQSQTTGSSIYLVKTDAQGDTLWTRTYGGPLFAEGSSVRQTSDDGYIVTGYTYSFGAGEEDVYLIKTNAVGDTLWTRTYGGAQPDVGNSVLQTMDGSYVVLGTGGSFGLGAPDSSNFYLIKTNGELDVGPVTILSPPRIVQSGDVYVPQVVVRNFGLTSGILPVTMEIGPDYAATVQETLVSAPEDTIVFPAWSAGPMGASLPLTCYTSLAGDEDPANDTIRDSIQVVGPPAHDVGATAILIPSGSVRAGDTVVPRTRIRNFGKASERFFSVRFRIGESYNRTANVSAALLPDSTVELTFAPWVADSGNWAVSCSTMLVGDEDRANDKVSSSVQVFAQSLAIEPDQSDRIEAGKSRIYQFYALILGDTGGVVEVARPSAPADWSIRLGDPTGVNDLTDTDADGIPDLGYVAPGESGWFSLDVTAPSELLGDTASLGQGVFLVAGHVGDRPDIADTAVLSLTLLPAFSVHNFPNPFSDQTTFVIGLPEDGKASLTVYTRAGARVCRVIENTDMPAGVHVVPWEGVNDNDRSIAPGTYEYLLDYVHAGKTERIHKRLVLSGQ